MAVLSELPLLDFISVNIVFFVADTAGKFMADFIKKFIDKFLKPILFCVISDKLWVYGKVKLCVKGGKEYVIDIGEVFDEFVNLALALLCIFVIYRIFYHEGIKKMVAK